MNYNSDTTGFICTTLHLQKVLQKSTKKCSRFFFTYVADDLPCKSKQNEKRCIFLTFSKINLVVI